MKIFDVAIIGAGPAGIFSALTAAKQGASVVLLEKNQILGRKILATGNGRCNLTNKNIAVSRYHGATPEFIQSVLSTFSQFQVMEYFESLGVLLKEEDNGRIFPRTNQASSITEALNFELQKPQINIRTNFLVKGIQPGTVWTISGLHEDQKICLQAKNLILATGGKASFILGSSGDGLFWAEKLGHSIITPHPALAPLETIETWPKEIQGLRFEGTAKTISDGKIILESFGDILFTHFGLSGPAIMKHARYINELPAKTKIELHLDAIPEETEKTLDKKIEAILNANGAKAVKNALAGVVPAELMLMVLKNLSIDEDKKSSRISKQERTKIVGGLKNIVLVISKTRPFKEAQVTAGGVDSKEINSQTLESKKIPHLFFAGEIIDVDGDSGGFNLQWAWSSGYLAGLSATTKIK